MSIRTYLQRLNAPREFNFDKVFSGKKFNLSDKAKTRIVAFSDGLAGVLTLQSAETADDALKNANLDISNHSSYHLPHLLGVVTAAVPAIICVYEAVTGNNFAQAAAAATLATYATTMISGACGRNTNLKVAPQNKAGN